VVAKWIIISLLVLVLLVGFLLFFFRITGLIGSLIIIVGSTILIIVNILEIKTIKKREYDKLIKEAEELYNSREPKNAFKKFQEALKVQPDSYEVYLGMAQCHRMLMKYENAVNAYHEATLIKPDAHHAYFLKGIVEMQLNRPYDSLKSFRAAEELKPDFEELHYFLGQLSEKTMQFKEAIRYYKKYVDNCVDCKMKSAIEQKLRKLGEKIKVYEPKLVEEKTAQKKVAAERKTTEPVKPKIKDKELEKRFVGKPLQEVSKPKKTQVEPVEKPKAKEKSVTEAEDKPEKKREAKVKEMLVEKIKKEPAAVIAEKQREMPAKKPERPDETGKREEIAELRKSKQVSPVRKDIVSDKKKKVKLAKKIRPKKAKVSLSAKEKAMQIIGKSPQVSKGFGTSGSEERYKGWNTMLNLQFGVDDMSKVRTSPEEKAENENES